MIEIKTIQLSKLLFLEVHPLVENILRIVEKHDPESLRLGDTLDILREQERQTDKLSVPYRGHYLTRKHKMLHERRLSYAAYFSRQLSAIYIGEFENTQEYTEIAYPIMKIHLMYLREETQSGVKTKINKFIYKLKHTPKLMEAFVKLGFKKNIEELERLNNECKEVKYLMQAELSQRPKVDKRAISKDAQSALRYVFDNINRYQRTFKDLNYEPLINELNGQLTVFSKNINLRTTLNKKRAKQPNKSDKKDNKTTTNNKNIAQNKQTSNLPAIIEKNQVNNALQDMLDMLKKMKDDKDKGMDKKNKPEED